MWWDYGSFVVELWRFAAELCVFLRYGGGIMEFLWWIYGCFVVFIDRWCVCFGLMEGLRWNYGDFVVEL